MRRNHMFGAILAAAALAAGGGLAGATTVPAHRPAGTEPRPARGAGWLGRSAGEAVTFETGLEFNSILLPKFTGIAVFDQANQGAQEAAAELGTTPGRVPRTDGRQQRRRPDRDRDQRGDAGRRRGDDLEQRRRPDRPCRAVARRRRRRRRVTWDSPIPAAEGERTCSSPRSTSTRPAR